MSGRPFITPGHTGDEPDLGAGMVVPVPLPGNEPEALERVDARLGCAFCRGLCVGLCDPYTSSPRDGER